MGDASQAKNLHQSRFRSQLIIEGQQARINTPEIQTTDSGGLSVFYTHAENDAELAHVPNGQIVCRSLEELLTYLEGDLVDSLWFDDTISSQERNYITGWARIFRPNVSSHRLVDKIAN